MNGKHRLLGGEAVIIIVARWPSEAQQWARDRSVSHYRIASSPAAVRGVSKGSEVRVLGYPHGTDGHAFATALGVLEACGVDVRYGPDVLALDAR